MTTPGRAAIAAAVIVGAVQAAAAQDFTPRPGAFGGPRAALLQQSAAARQAQSAREQAEARRAAQEQRAIANWPEATENFSRTLRLGRNGTFDLQNVAGDIIVTGGGGDQVRIEALKRARHRLETQARAVLPDVRIEVIERGGSIEVRTLQPRRRDAATAVDYRVTLPRGAQVMLATQSGNVRVSNVDGELRARSGSGNVTASDVRRIRQISTVSGNVEVADGEADELTANTIGGHVTLRNLRGRVLDLRTVTGDVRLIGLELDRARLESMSGDLEYAGRLARSGRYEFQTYSGTIRVTPQGNPGFDLQASSLNGDVRSDYALQGTEAEPAPRRNATRSLRGRFGDAGAVVNAASFNGDILIVRR
jgi:hypothetical protein